MRTLFLGFVLLASFFSRAAYANIDALHELKNELYDDPIFDGALTEVCIDNDCVTVDKSHMDFRKSKNMKTVSNKKEIVNTLIEGVTSKGSMGGTVSISYKNSVTHPNGAEETTEVEVTISGGNGSAADTAAGGD